jgi:hypothetical protein
MTWLRVRHTMTWCHIVKGEPLTWLCILALGQVPRGVIAAEVARSGGRAEEAIENLLRSQHEQHTPSPRAGGAEAGRPVTTTGGAAFPRFEGLDWTMGSLFGSTSSSQRPSSPPLSIFRRFSPLEPTPHQAGPTQTHTRAPEARPGTPVGSPASAIGPDTGASPSPKPGGGRGSNGHNGHSRRPSFPQVFQDLGMRFATLRCAAEAAADRPVPLPPQQQPQRERDGYHHQQHQHQHQHQHQQEPGREGAAQAPASASPVPSRGSDAARPSVFTSRLPSINTWLERLLDTAASPSGGSPGAGASPTPAVGAIASGSSVQYEQNGL